MPSAVLDPQVAAPQPGEGGSAVLQYIPPAGAEPVQSLAAVIDRRYKSIPSPVAEPMPSATRDPQLAAPQPGEGGSAVLQTVPPAVAETVSTQAPSAAPANDKPVERRENAGVIAPFPPATVPATATAPDKPANPAPHDPAAAPAKIAGLNLSPPISTPTAAHAPPAAELAGAGDLAPPLGPPIPPSGTPVATNGQRMKSALQKNEIAGSAAQKLPPDRQTVAAAAAADEAIPAPKGRSPADFSDPKQTSAPWMMMDPAAKGAAAPAPTAKVAGGGAPSSGRIEQVERMISREVVMVRQSGAEALSVSLKVDARTSLFLQLTNHYGQIEASVRCESGDAGALGAHWGQLQESLARHNVQLLPLENKSFSAGPSSDPPAENPRNFQDGPSAQHPPPRPPAPEREKPSDDAMNAAVGLAKPKNQTRRQHGWEKWA
jgi:hypothetical protein